MPGLSSPGGAASKQFYEETVPVWDWYPAN